MRVMLLAGLMVLISTAVFAEDARIDGLVAALNQVGAGRATEGATVGGIARVVALPAEALREEQAQASLPWGDVFVAHRIATRSGHPIARVFAARKTGASWHDIASDADVDETLLEQDLLAAFPTLTPIPVPPPPAPPPPAPTVTAPAPPPEQPAVTSPTTPGTRPAEPPDKKRSFGDRLRGLFKGELATEPSKDQPSDRGQAIRDFIGGNSRPR